MTPLDRKKVTVITKYIVDSFTESDWLSLGQVTASLNVINDHPRLLRALAFGDDDYAMCTTEVLNTIFSASPEMIDDVIDHFDIDLWYEQKHPDKYKKVFLESSIRTPDFWKEGDLKAFISHLSGDKVRTTYLKNEFSKWGISAFVAHEDIEPTREWQNEVEAALETMDVTIAIVQPGFKESDWCSQEVGYALGRKIEIVPLRAGLDPYGLFGKYQGIQVKGKKPGQAAEEVVTVLLKKPKHRTQLLQNFGTSFSTMQSSEKISKIRRLLSWSIATDEQIKSLLERSSLSDCEKNQLSDVILKVGAFPQPIATTPDYAEDVPF